MSEHSPFPWRSVYPLGSKQRCAAVSAADHYVYLHVFQPDDTREKIRMHQANADLIAESAARLAASEQQCAAVWKALGFPDGHEGDLVAAARKLKQDHDSLAETAKDADNELAEAVKQRNALGVRVADLEECIQSFLRILEDGDQPRMDYWEKEFRAALATPAPEPSQPFECPMCAPGTCPGGAHVNALWEDGIRTREQYAAMAKSAPTPEKKP
jgi:hypothetical protein